MEIDWEAMILANAIRRLYIQRSGIIECDQTFRERYRNVGILELIYEDHKGISMKAPLNPELLEQD